MAKITAWKCDTTGKIFEYEKDYTKHLRQMASQRRIERIRNNRLLEFQTLINTLYDLPAFEDIAQWLIDNQDMLYEYAVFKGFSWCRNELRGDRITKFEFLKMRYNKSWSNSHSAPKGFPTNCGGNKGLHVPRGYPGWNGRISFTNEKRGWHFKEAIQNIGIHSGSGGSGEFDCTIWAGDFRKLAEPYVLAKLSGDIE